MSGELVLVSTPIGNLSDLSPRAAATLSGVDVVCCEDTRHTGVALKRLGIEAKRLVSLHAHNERQRIPALVSDLVAGARVAVVSDAGTPGVSDPGELLVAAAIEAGVRVSTVPGPSAVLAALAVAGMGMRRWVYEGFLARKGRERAEALERVAASGAPVVIFESPKRVAATLADLAEVCGCERRVAVCRELTKLHEDVWRGTLGEAARAHAEREPKGEIVLVVEGRPSGARERPRAEELRERVDSMVGAGRSRRDAVDAVAAESGLSRREVYEATLGRAGKGPEPGGR